MLDSCIYRRDGVLQENPTAAEVAGALLAGTDVLWLDFLDPTEEELAILIDTFKFHPLAIEDCLLPRHHPKVDNYGDYLFMIIHAPDLTTSASEVSTHELDIFLGANYVVTFHDKPVKSITAAAVRAAEEPARTMGRGADFLLCEILDALFGNYDILLDRLQDAIDSCENDTQGQCSDRMGHISSVQHTTYSLYRTVRMQREFLRNLSRGIHAQISKEAVPYFRDIYDHLVRINETLDLAVEGIRNAREAYLYDTSNRLNNVIRVLTVLTVVIMVPTLLAGIYGMNLRNFPGQEAPAGFWTVLAMMVASILLTLFWFKRKGWY